MLKSLVQQVSTVFQRIPLALCSMASVASFFSPTAFSLDSIDYRIRNKDCTDPLIENVSLVLSETLKKDEIAYKIKIEVLFGFIPDVEKNGIFKTDPKLFNPSFWDNGGSYENSDYSAFGSGSENGCFFVQAEHKKEDIIADFVVCDGIPIFGIKDMDVDFAVGDLAANVCLTRKVK